MSKINQGHCQAAGATKTAHAIQSRCSIRAQAKQHALYLGIPFPVMGSFVNGVLVAHCQCRWSSRWSV